MVVMTAPPIMVMMVMTAPPAIMMMVMSPSAVMMVMILHQRHGRVRLGRLRAPSRLGRIHGLQHRESVGDRLEEFGVGLRGGQPRRIGALEAGGLGAIERRQTGNRAYDADNFVHLRLLGVD